jgi:hypothetical protein
MTQLHGTVEVGVIVLTLVAGFGAVAVPAERRGLAGPPCRCHAQREGDHGEHSFEAT